MLRNFGIWSVPKTASSVVFWYDGPKWLDQFMTLMDAGGPDGSDGHGGRGGQLTSLDASFMRCFGFFQTSSKTSRSMFFSKHR